MQAPIHIYNYTRIAYVTSNVRATCHGTETRLVFFSNSNSPLLSQTHETDMVSDDTNMEESSDFNSEDESSLL